MLSHLVNSHLKTDSLVDLPAADISPHYVDLDASAALCSTFETGNTLTEVTGPGTYDLFALIGALKLSLGRATGSVISPKLARPLYEKLANRNIDSPRGYRKDQESAYGKTEGHHFHVRHFLMIPFAIGRPSQTLAGEHPRSGTVLAKNCKTTATKWSASDLQSSTNILARRFVAVGSLSYVISWWNIGG